MNKIVVTWKKSSYIVLFIYVLAVFLRASIGTIAWDEIDSNALPVISLQYRFSTICNEDDLIKAQEDFPILYEGITSYENLRSSKLVYANESTWVPYYFPIYPF